MKPRGPLPTITWVLLGLIAIAALTLSLGRNSDVFNPAPSSFNPSGTRAFADLLRTQGYRVAYSEDPGFKLAPNDVPIAFAVQNNGDLEDLAYTNIKDFVSDGGKAIWIGLDPSFEQSSEGAMQNLISIPVNGTKAQVRINAATNLLPEDLPQTDSFPLAEWQGSPLAQIVVSRGKILGIGDGIIATNRFIDKNDNAKLLMSWVRTVAPPGSELVFMGATYGAGSVPGVIETMGAWALAAWWQLILLFVVIVYTLGKPFGYPDELRPKQYAAREFVDAVAQTYRRAKATNIAMWWISKDADHELRRRLKISYDAPIAERDRHIPEKLAKTLLDAQAARDIKLPPNYALRIAKSLDSQMKDFLGDTRFRRRALRKGR